MCYNLIEDDNMSRRKRRKKRNLKIDLKLYLFLLIFGIYCINYYNYNQESINKLIPGYKTISYNINEIPKYNGESYIIINNNEPFFEKKDMTTNSFERYSEHDFLGRCGTAFANISKDLMPIGERGSIGQIKPSGWHTVKYDIVDGKYLYNRCHLIGYQLTGENANEKNLITCTRYMNTVGMLQFENKVAEYVKKTNNHVLYRVTPIFEDNNLLASGVEIEAMSVEDNGKGIKFNVYVYNIQEGITIDYSNGESSLKN